MCFQRLADRADRRTLLKIAAVRHITRNYEFFGAMCLEEMELAADFDHAGA